MTKEEIIYNFIEFHAAYYVKKKMNTSSEWYRWVEPKIGLMMEGVGEYIYPSSHLMDIINGSFPNYDYNTIKKVLRKWAKNR